MFQVASHPSSFASHGHGHHQPSHSHAMPASTVQLPRTLARPAFAEVSRDAITATSPELANVPPEYIRRGLRSKVNQMLGGISALAPSHLPEALPRSHLPPALSIPLRATTADPSYPTHALAVTSSKSSSDQALIFPVHALVLASHCASLPRLPASHQAPNSPTLNLPVLPLSLPSPTAFRILHSFMYTHRLDKVLSALFPCPTAFLANLSHANVLATLSSGQSLHQLSSYLCKSASSNLQVLTQHAAHVKETWQDMAALGLNDPELWDTIDLAWEVVLGALNLAAAGK